MNRYNPNLWNINGIMQPCTTDSDEVLINRTNNPLERYNRTLKEQCGVPHPSITKFVEGIATLSTTFLDKHKAIFRKQAPPPKHKPTTYYSVPRDYFEFNAIHISEISDYARLDCHRDVLSCGHYDPDDKTTYRVVKLGFYENKVVEYRQLMHIVDDEAEPFDIISIEEIRSYMSYQV